MATRYKFVELSVVTEESLEKAVNEWVGQGWNLDAIRFVTGEQSRRPQMAFVSFVRDEADGRGARDAREHDDAVTLPLPARSEIRRKHKILELGEIDPGDIEPYDADLDWENAVTKPGRPGAKQEAPPQRGKGKGKGRGKGQK